MKYAFRKISFCFLFLLSILCIGFIDEVKAVENDDQFNILIDAEGITYPGGNGTIRTVKAQKYELSGCYALKVNLVKLTDSGPDWVTFYYLFGNDNTSKTYHQLFTNQKWGVSNAITTANGDVGAVGQIYPSNYATNSAFAAQIVTVDDLDIKNSFFLTGPFMLNFDVAKTKSSLKNGNTPTDTFYKILYQLLTTTRQRNSKNWPEIDMSKIKSWSELKTVLTSKQYSDEQMAFRDYRIVIEPLYTFKMDDKHYLYTTMKSAANYLNTGYFSGVNKQGFLNNCYSKEIHGTISGIKSTDTLADMTNVNSGRGYFIVTIVNDNFCDPTKECCYDSSGTYHKEYKSKTTNYKCSSVNADSSCAKDNLVTCVRPCPEGTKGPYINYYMFLANATDTKLDNYAKSNTPMHTTGENSEFSDVEIFQNLIREISKKDNVSYTLNEVQMLESRVVDIDSSNVQKFYENYMLVRQSPKKYLKIDGEYYLTHTKWCSISNGVTTCYDTSSTLEQSTASDYARRSIYAKSYNIIATRNSSNTGFQFDLNRYFHDSTTQKNHMMSSNPITGGTYYHPAEYKISYCISETIEETCNDSVTPAECYSTDVGTKVVFHENDDLKTCTLKKDNHSGFTIVESTETNNYCTVACKDDIDIELPTTKETAAGQYFTLDNYTPKISAKRTCVTSKINYDSFESDLKTAESNMINAYNVWQDYLAYYNHTLKIGKGTNHTGVHEWTTGGRCIKVEDDPCGKKTEIKEHSCSYNYNSWSDSGMTGPNGTEFGSESGDEGTKDANHCPYYDDTDSRAYLRQKAKNNAKEKERLYTETLETYHNLISAYQKCSSWLDNTKFTFEPTVTFDYDDQDGIVFSTPYVLDYDKVKVFDPKITYWTEYSEDTDSNYSIGGDTTADLGESLDRIYFNLVSCDGEKCEPISDTTLTNSDRSISNVFYTSKFIKRTEEIEYTYRLPTLYTIVPSGVVTTDYNDSQTKLTLEDNSVPVNINTVGGTYNYSLKITDIDDDLRKNKKSKNPDDDFQDRFNQTALNAGDEYICNYKVVNDIYVPGDNPYLNFFYRTVDMADINPNNRDLGYNWSDYRAQEVMRRMQETAADYQDLTSSSHDVFSFTLTPAIMKEIRNYNATKHNTANGSYSDFDLKCHDYSEDGYHCESNFLTCLTSGGETNIPGQTSCTDIFGSSLTNYNSVSNYNYTALINNRQLLIDKQNQLDGR